LILVEQTLGFSIKIISTKQTHNTFFDPNAFSTVWSDDLAEQSYRNGEISIHGLFYEDYYHVGDVSFEQIFTTPQDGSTWSEIMNIETSGSLGLSWNDCITTNAYDPIRHLLRAYNATEQVYTIWLSSVYPKPSTGNTQAALTIGGHDEFHCGPVLLTIPHAGKWSRDRHVTSERFSMGAYSTAGDSTVFDSGYPVITFPDKVYDAVFKLVNPTYDWDYGLYTVSCAKISTLPDWVFRFSGMDFAVPSSQYIIDVELPNGNCVVAFSRIEYSSKNPYTLGAPFLRQFCTTYSIDKNHVQLSKSS